MEKKCCKNIEEWTEALNEPIGVRSRVYSMIGFRKSPSQDIP
jgi:hypothetical protein